MFLTAPWTSPSDLKEVTKQIYSKYKQDQLNPPRKLTTGLIKILFWVVLVSVTVWLGGARLDNNTSWVVLARNAMVRVGHGVGGNADL